MLRRAIHPAFTLIELLVTLIVIGVLAGLAAPRLLSTEERRAETQVRGAAALLTSAAQRSVVGREPIAIAYAHQAGELRLEVLRPPRATTDAEAGARWGVDPFMPPVRLESLRIARLSIDGREQGVGDARVEITPGSMRPALALVLRRYSATADRFDERGRSWLIELASHAPTARIVGLRSDEAALTPQPIDLDALGEEESPW